MRHYFWIVIFLGAVSLGATVQETELRRLEVGRALATGREMRPWKFSAWPAPMQSWSTEVKGAFVELRCEDHEFSSAVLILLRDDFRLRSYPAKLLSPADRALAEKLEVQRRQSVSPKVRTEYPLVWKQYTKANADVSTSEHFAFYTGRETASSGKKAFTPGFLDNQKVWFEKVWTHLDSIGAPMPMAADAAPRKLNVFVTGTGLEKHKEGFAFGGADVIMHPNALGDGSSVVIHEFTHSVQYYSKGFRDSAFVGWFWECHANWSTHQFMPAYPPVLAHYAERAHYELNSSRHNYGSWPFLQVLAEDPRFGWSFPYEIWPACRRNPRDGALEDPFQTIMRVGVERKIWKEGVEGFGDTIGELAARMVGWDFQNQYFQLKEIRNLARTNNRVASLATVLEEGRDGRWYPLHSHAPKQYGVNIIWLEAGATSKTVELEFTGIADSTENADWRATLVAVDGQDRCRYSPTVHGGRLTLDFRPGESYALAVAATPTKYVPQEFRPGFAVKRRYPYAVKLLGTTTLEGTAAVERASKVAGALHPNGGGFVAKSAKVAPSAYVGPLAQVLEGAKVTGNARITGQAIVRQSAQVGGDAVISGLARVGDRARVEGSAHVGGYAKISGKALLTGNAHLLEYATLDGEGTVAGDVMIRGFGEVHLIPTTEIAGSAMFAEDLEVHFAGGKTPRFERGLFYGYLNADLLQKPKEVVDNRGLYAHWQLTEAHAPIMRDLLGDADGTLSTLPGQQATGAFGRDGTVTYLQPSQAGVRLEGHILNTRNLALEAKVYIGDYAPSTQNWAILEANNPAVAFAFGVLPNGTLRLLLGHQNKAAVLESSAKIPTNRWVRLAVTIKDGQVTFWIDGVKAGGGQLGERRLVELWSETTKLNPATNPIVTLGRDFRGRLAELKITHTGELPNDDTPARK